MRITIGEMTLVEKEGAAILSRRSLASGQMNSMTFTGYKATQIAEWIVGRARGTAKLIQDEFPLMTNEQREFLISGTTPDEWARLFPKEDEDDAA